ncbi:Dam family site-specific DNA-(adenine-N6)-methyltransferase [Leptolyngbya sp. FACHB-36]|uniref:DNA adenine methylase n=1 Tax=Leptolyngbya sp. FACHB-36 TaxID=2692808 RepID=UPI0016814A27|nr:Dam family site-specific DNA-(adenine-N6)-methyltransferase [Leptolyngbya sp. FACHB-36]MBD2022014.1 Dam family site-specific DNA-(adenine-N6)-methyltransferase [Leptolyngbya sp. FACHB-36]
MVLLPAELQRVGIPPIKCQGIKSKLVAFIGESVRWNGEGRWIEPFLGSGVVAFNLLPPNALLADSNCHIIRFYQAIQQGTIDRLIVQTFLTQEGRKLQTIGAEYYYEVRDRFNQSASSLDFLFLNRACFNGIMRFNRRGKFNVPFCRKPLRFSQSYITKIANQVNWVAQQMSRTQWEFRVAPWSEIVQEAQSTDFVYLDPPYIGRHTDYYSAWTMADAEQLAIVTQQLPCGFAVSMWLENQHRKNDHIQQHWAELELRLFQHYYHVGATENWRGEMTEALLIKPEFAI